MATKKDTTQNATQDAIADSTMVKESKKEIHKDSKKEPIAPEKSVSESKDVSKDREKKEKDSVTETKVTEKYFAGVGRRKTAVAIVRIFEDVREGESEVLVNGKKAKEYFPTLRLLSLFLDPIRTIGLENKFRISVHTRGGGPSGQASASGLGLARALVVFNAEHRALLKAGKFLTRDSRKVERKKPGLNKARRAPQWSKR